MLKVGIIGAGKMGINHLKAIKGCTNVQLVGIADPAASIEELQDVVPNGCQVLTSADELLQRCRPDVVHIVTPPHTHVSIASQAIRAGSHIYVEKPFALNGSDAEAVLALAREHRRSVCAGHQCLFDHAAIEGRQALKAIGRVVRIESYFSFRQVRRSISPVEQAKDILPHAVYMLLDYLRAAHPDLANTDVLVRHVEVAADGSVEALLKLGACFGTVVVTLAGRPVEQFLKVTGTNGSVRVDLVRGAVIALTGPGASAPAALIDPYRESAKIAVRSTRGFARHIKEMKYGYPGLRALSQAFYDHVHTGAPLPMSPSAILEAVAVCARIGDDLDRAEREHEAAATIALENAERSIAPPDASRGVVLVTGAGGFLGRELVTQLRSEGYGVRALVRALPRPSTCVPGVEYRACELSRELPATLMEGVSAVVHCAAGTQGGKSDQERNSIAATRHVVTAAGAAGVRRLIHISSVAVMRPPSASTVMNESTPIDADSLDRGPYVWGKARSEKIASEIAAANGISLRIIRLGPLVDYKKFTPPGRLGRELGPIFVAIGPRRGPLSLVDVARAASVIRAFLADFDGSPELLNLVEPTAPTRQELAARLVQDRPDLRVYWFPATLLRLISPPLKLVQRLLLGSKQPLDIASAFMSPRYETTRAAAVMARAEERDVKSPAAAVAV